MQIHTHTNKLLKNNNLLTSNQNTLLVRVSLSPLLTYEFVYHYHISYEFLERMRTNGNTPCVMHASCMLALMAIINCFGCYTKYNLKPYKCYLQSQWQVTIMVSCYLWWKLFAIPQRQHAWSQDLLVNFIHESCHWLVQAEEGDVALVPMGHMQRGCCLLQEAKTNDLTKTKKSYIF